MSFRSSKEERISCLDSLFSVFLPMPTHRILSDKKLAKQRKINLSLADDKKSKTTQKLIITNSFNAKKTPSTNEALTNNVKYNKT